MLGIKYLKRNKRRLKMNFVKVSTIALALLLTTALVVKAAMPLERFRQQNETQQLILTDTECTAFPNPNKLYLLKAYALNIPTNETYPGCWELLEDGRVHIIVVISEKRDIFEFFYPQTDFELRPNL